MTPKLPISAPAAAGLTGLALGLFLSTSWSTPEAREQLHTLVNSPVGEVLDPVRALPRTTLVLAMQEARSNLETGRPWAAWKALDVHLESPDAPASAVLLGARAAGEWGGWREVRGLLNGREWLERAEGGEGLYLLGRAEEEREAWPAAAAAYRRYLNVARGEQRGIAAARLGRVLGQAGQSREAALAFSAAAAELAPVSDWMRALAAEAAAREGALAGEPSARDAAPALVRRARAEAAAWTTRGDTASALEALERDARGLTSRGEAGEAVPLVVERARLLAAGGDAWRARDLLRAAAMEPTAEPRVRAEAARLLGEVVSARSAAEERARAAAFQAAGRPGQAARALLASGAADDPAFALQRVQLLVEARDWGPARAAARAVAGRVSDPELVAEAELHAARARLRRGDRSAATDELMRITERRSGSVAAASAAFLLGEIGSDRQRAIARYREAAANPRSPDAREALFRVGDRSLRDRDPAAAIRAWEGYVARYPHGPQTAEVAYRVGVMHERAGRESQARSMYTATLLADPVSYPAVLAANRLGVRPLDRTLGEPRPWVGLASDERDAAVALARLAVLERAGLDAEWAEELAAAERRFERRPFALLTVAEGVRDAGHTIAAIRIGRRLLDGRGGAWDGRLLRVVFPLGFREVLEREAERTGVDPMLLAALVRQESSWNPEARSRVGAAGLSQIMPSTGRWLAPSVGMDDFEVRHLNVPEVNLRMGARYLADLLKRYDGAADLALAGYNAGPSRADRWRRELGHARDAEAFRERIPFDETRHYVQVVLRNAAVYRALYGPDRPAGLADPR